MEMGQLGLAEYFDHPKPLGLLAKCIRVCTGPTDLILDFFAGSGTTAHAVLDLNRREGSSRRFILTQLPEPTSFKEFPTIATITRERVRRVIKQLTVADTETLKLDTSHTPDQGFRAFALAQSNLLVWDGDTIAGTTEVEQQLSLHVRHLRQGRTDQDLLFEILLREGFEMTTHSEVVEVGTQKAHSLAEGALIISLSRSLDLESVRAIADRGPQRVVCLDEGFAGNDQLKANAAQMFKAKGIVFRTV
jgi:adenine-specific DNA-methyltransferase